VISIRGFVLLSFSPISFGEIIGRSR
jgi:hypothetical protein